MLSYSAALVRQVSGGSGPTLDELKNVVSHLKIDFLDSAKDRRAMRTMRHRAELCIKIGDVQAQEIQESSRNILTTFLMFDKFHIHQCQAQIEI